MTCVWIVWLVYVLFFSVLGTANAFFVAPRVVYGGGWGLWCQGLGAADSRTGSLESWSALVGATTHCRLVGLAGDVLLLLRILSGTPQRYLTIFLQVLFPAVLSFKLLILIGVRLNNTKLQVARLRLFGTFGPGRLSLLIRVRRSKLVLVAIKWILWNTWTHLWAVSFYSFYLIYSLYETGLAFSGYEFGKTVCFLLVGLSWFLGLCFWFWLLFLSLSFCFYNRCLCDFFFHGQLWGFRKCWEPRSWSLNRFYSSRRLMIGLSRGSQHGLIVCVPVDFFQHLFLAIWNPFTWPAPKVSRCFVQSRPSALHTDEIIWIIQATNILNSITRSLVEHCKFSTCAEFSLPFVLTKHFSSMRRKGHKFDFHLLFGSIR